MRPDGEGLARFSTLGSPYRRGRLNHAVHLDECLPDPVLRVLDCFSHPEHRGAKQASLCWRCTAAAAERGVAGEFWEDAENVPVRTMKVSPKRAKIAGRAGLIWHYVALRGTTWHKSAPYIVVVRGFARSGSRASAWAKDQHDRSSAPHARSARGALTSEACETVGGRGAAPPRLCCSTSGRTLKISRIGR